MIRSSASQRAENLLHGFRTIMNAPKTLQQAIQWFSNEENCIAYMVEQRTGEIGVIQACVGQIGG